NPNIAFAVLRQRVNGAFREALFLLPGLKGERPRAVGNPWSSVGPGAAHIHKVTEGSGDCQIAKVPTAALAGMSQTNFIEAGIHVKPRRQAFRLIGLICSGAKVRIQPDRDEIIFARNKLHFKDNRDSCPTPWVLI